MSEGTKLDQNFGSEAAKVVETEEKVVEETTTEAASTEATPEKAEEKKEEATEKKAPTNPNSVDTSDVEDLVQVAPALPDEKDFDNELDLFKAAIETSLVDFKEGDVVKGVIRSIEKSGLLIDISYKSDGFVPNSEFSDSNSLVPTESLVVGDMIDVYIEKLETKEGYTLLSCKKAEYELMWKKMGHFLDSKETLNVKVLSVVRGGVVVTFSGIRGFIPLSHLLIDNKSALDGLVGTVLPVIVLNVDESRRKVVFSNRMAQKKPLTADAVGLMDSLEVGQIHKGVVSSLKDFGAFIDIGGIEGLAHISELSWSRVSHPSEILTEGSEVEVFVLGVDKDKQRISFGLKQLQEDPWSKVMDRYTVGQVLQGTVSRIVPFGAFVQLEPNLEGLIHISEFSDSHVKNIRDLVKEDDKVTIKVIRLQPEEQKIGLSLKNIKDAVSTPASEEAVVESTPEVAEAAAEEGADKE